MGLRVVFQRKKARLPGGNGLSEIVIGESGTSGLFPFLRLVRFLRLMRFLRRSFRFFLFPDPESRFESIPESILPLLVLASTMIVVPVASGLEEDVSQKYDPPTLPVGQRRQSEDFRHDPIPEYHDQESEQKGQSGCQNHTADYHTNV
jgi:hypothetical protein